MIEIQLEVTGSIGFHARPAAQFVQTAAAFQSKIKVTGNNRVADGKSILGVMSLGLAKGDNIAITAEGLDEQECIDALAKLIEEEVNEK
jgi:phosphocarrier protein HPr